MPDGTGPEVVQHLASPDVFLDIMTGASLGGAEKPGLANVSSVRTSAVPINRQQAIFNARAQSLVHGPLHNLGGCHWAGLAASRRARATNRWRFQR